MVAQALTLEQIATGLGISVPAVVDLFSGQGIDLSGFGESDIIPLEDLLPESELNRIKNFRTYGESFYRPEPVVGSTVLETKKDDDDIIDVKEEDLEKMPTTEVTRGDEDPEEPKDQKESETEEKVETEEESEANQAANQEAEQEVRITALINNNPDYIKELHAEEHGDGSDYSLEEFKEDLTEKYKAMGYREARRVLSVDKNKKKQLKEL